MKKATPAPKPAGPEGVDTPAASSSAGKRDWAPRVRELNNREVRDLYGLARAQVVRISNQI